MSDSAKGVFPLGLVITVLVLLWAVWFFFLKAREQPAFRSVAVLVLGDIGRSPRMMYHAESFATNDFETYLIGYAGSKPVPSLMSLPRVHFLYLSSPPAYLSSLPFIISAPRKVLHQVISILHTLLVRIEHPPEFIIVQNPPSIPTLALVWLVAQLRGSKVIIDWHNLGYSILALKLGDQHILVRVAKMFEAYFGRSAYAHLFVTHAMRDFLVREWHLKGHKVVLHDRPPAHFHRASPGETHELFLRLQSGLALPVLSSFLPESTPPYSTPFTAMPSTPHSDPARPSDDIAADFAPMPALRDDRPALIVSSTSWTPDEDFSILLDALARYEQRASVLNADSDAPHLPKLLAIVTGKGPLRDQYMRKVGQMQSGANGGEPWRFVRCISLWLEAEDYPLLLGSADLGISLHSSSSALDLPMKVVDMFGCGLPVCALGFACLDELVKEGVNGLVFHNAEQLAAQLETLLGSQRSTVLQTLRSSLQRPMPIAGEQDWQWGTWAQNWDATMRPLVLRDVDISYTRAPGWVKLIPGFQHDSSSSFWSIARLAFPDTRSAVLADAGAHPTRPSEQKGSILSPDEQLLCYDYLYYVCGQQPDEIDHDYSPAWRFVLRHFKFTRHLEELADGYLRRTLNVPEGDSIPPYITVHARRGDFSTWCGGVPRDECFPSLQVFARRVSEVQQELQTKHNINATQVIMTSDESDETWWDAVRELGWSRMDHRRELTVELHGNWYPVILDAVAQSRGIGFVGTDRSTFSILAKRRVQDWNGGVVRTVKWGRPDSDAH
ncbi:uncharacterized protein FIBRA_01989 [Fibroporia radiculosa]|uniref:Chitobiosyldiphosphodolichol beta-mannosyltransferase n=1 Tax=Fibroporia radiculosa TaxID=599839 RepID=J4H1K4_9APHY|nr:uncharacterized protein FIBRA_01989 [Fibroporia radiculosa]CCL99964.1 predicted protein [Fibroporia radiculosa]